MLRTSRLKSYSLALLALLFGAVFAQVPNAPAQLSGVLDTKVSGLTAGNAFGVMAYGGYMYADNTSATYTWLSQAWDRKFLNQVQIKTKTTDAATTGNGDVITFNIDAGSAYLYVCVIHPDAIVAKPTWLSGSYSDTGDDAFIDTNSLAIGSVFCTQTASAPGTTVHLGGNCSTTCSGQQMYVAFVTPHWNPPKPIGRVTFSAASYTQNEQTNLTVPVQRIGGSFGPCTVQVQEGFNPNNGVLNTSSLSWVAGDSTDKNISLDLADVTVDSDMTLVLASPVGCSIGTLSTATINITFVPTGGQGTYGFLGAQSVSNNESTSFLRCGATRQDGSTGAVSVNISVTSMNDGMAGGTCDTPGDYTVSNAPLNAAFANGESGDDTEALMFTANNVSADCTITCGFSGAAGGWTLTGTGNTTKQVTIVNVGGGGGGCTLQDYYPWSTGTLTDMGLAISGNGPTLVTPPQRETGAKSMRSFIDRVNSSNPFRTEIEGVGTRPVWRVATWYGFSLYVPTGFSASNLYNGPYFQFHAEPLDWNELDVMQSPDWYLTIEDNNGSDSAQFGRWYVESNRAHVAEGMGQAASAVSSRFHFGATGLSDKTGKWHDFVLKIVPDWRRPEDGGIGYWELYYNGSLAASVSVGTGVGANTSLAHNLYVKAGNYKRSWENRTTPSDIITQRWIYLGPLRIGTAAAGCGQSDVAPVGSRPIESVN